MSEISLTGEQGGVPFLRLTVVLILLNNTSTLHAGLSPSGNSALLVQKLEFIWSCAPLSKCISLIQNPLIVCKDWQDYWSNCFNTFALIKCIVLYSTWIYHSKLIFKGLTKFISMESGENSSCCSLESTGETEFWLSEWFSKALLKRLPDLRGENLI